MPHSDNLEEQILSVLDSFALAGSMTGFTQWMGGHINQTYVVKMQEHGVGESYVLQRINGRVFRNIPVLMDNAIRVSEHAIDKLAANGANGEAVRRGAIRFLRTRDGTPFCPDPSGDAWRLYPCIERADAKLTADTPTEAYEAALAFGRFQHLLADLPGARLQETIPGFHDTRLRYAQLDNAARTDAVGRTAAMRAELQACFSRTAAATVLQCACEDGAFPERTVHNDAKLSNVLLDSDTRKAVCVIDLDTVMPGLALHDFGDLVRSICNPADEAEPDTSKIEIRLPFFEALVAGYLDAAGDMLTAAEVELLPESGWVMTLELATRFLADYLNGDHYFRIKYPEHNLVRTRSQLALAQRLEEAQPAMREIVRRYQPSAVPAW